VKGWNWGKRGRELAIFVAIGCLLAFMGTYGVTAEFGFPIAVAYWTGLILVGSATGEVVTAWLSRRFGLRSWAAIVVPVSLATALAVFAVLQLFEATVAKPIPLVAWPRMFGMVWVIALAMTSVGWLLNRALEPQQAFSAQAQSSTAMASPSPDERIRAFLRRLPQRFAGASLIAVSAEDHYLRVHTDKGSDLILMRLSDAVAELAGTDGLQVHRSWWVSRRAVEGTRRVDGRLELVLTQGLSVPVARGRMDAVRQAGLV
jgi:hypothetical protein